MVIGVPDRRDDDDGRSSLVCVCGRSLWAGGHMAYMASQAMLGGHHVRAWALVCGRNVSLGNGPIKTEPTTEFYLITLITLITI